jgi:hypothetical protein
MSHCKHPADLNAAPARELTTPPTVRKPAGSETIPAALDAVNDALSRMRFGAVHLTVHDGRVVQIDVTERRRFT